MLRKWTGVEYKSADGALIHELECDHWVVGRMRKRDGCPRQMQWCPQCENRKREKTGRG
jgi:hypothetical protein